MCHPIRAHDEVFVGDRRGPVAVATAKFSRKTRLSQLKKSTAIFAFDSRFAGKKEISFRLRVEPDKKGLRQIKHLQLWEKQGARRDVAALILLSRERRSTSWGNQAQFESRTGLNCTPGKRSRKKPGSIGRSLPTLCERTERRAIDAQWLEVRPHIHESMSKPARQACR